MAERKSGPVKPPTIDLTARSADTSDHSKPATGKPAAAAGARPADTPKAAAAGTAPSGTPPRSGTDSAPSGNTEAPRPHSSKPEPSAPKAPGPAPQSRVLMAGIAGAVAGGIIGLGGAYGLASLGYWPDKANTAGIAALSDEVKSLYVKKSDIGSVIDRSVGDVASEIAGLKDRIAALESRTPADTAPAVDALDARVAALETGLGDLGRKLDAAAISGGNPTAEAALQDLGNRLDTLSAAVSDLQSKTVAAPESVSALETGLAALKDEVGQLSAGLTALQPVADEVKGLQASVAALQAVPAPKPVDLRLPLALSGMTDALETGAPFASELALVQAALPDLDIPGAVTAAAETGLGSPAALSARFSALVPDILAAKPVAANADWTDQLLERLKALVALRPVASAGGDMPEALVSRIETALAAQDYATAEAAFAALPEPMQAAAGGIDQSVDRFAATAELIARARAEALKLAGAAS